MNFSMRSLRSLMMVFLIGLMAAVPSFAADLVAIPSLQARVTDLTATLSAEQRGALEATLESFERERGSQLGIVLLPSTQPEAIEQFGIRLAEAWKLGRKGTDDGVIVIVAKNDHRIRLEVGYGLEGALNDATAKRIISETITPRFKNGDYYGGLQAGVAAILGVISGETLPPLPQGSSPGHAAEGKENLLMFGLIAVVLIGSALRALLGNLIGASMTGAAAGLAVWLFSSSLLVALLAAGAGVILSLFGLNIAWGILTSRGGRFGGGGGGGGFGGGGGGFGGGGASGGW